MEPDQAQKLFTEKEIINKTKDNPQHGRKYFQIV